MSPAPRGRGTSLSWGSRKSDGFRRDRVELLLLALLLALACAPLAGLILRVWVRGDVVTGGDGFLVVDPLQYLNWLRQAGDHLAVANLYDIRPSSHDFVHPAILVSGLLHRAGLGLVAAYDIWKPVAVLALFLASRRYVHRFLAGPQLRWMALGLALFACSPVSAVVGWSGVGGEQTKFNFDFIGGELWPGTWLWGYVFTVLAVAAVPVALLSYERGRSEGRRGLLGVAAAAGVAAAWLQPWQGATLAVILVVAEGVEILRHQRRMASALTDLMPVMVALALPLAYYWILGREDPAWALAAKANDFPRWPWYVTVIGLAPLGLPALLAYRRPAADFGSVALRLWPLAALAVFYQPAGTFPFHALQGVALPLSVLAVQGVSGLRRDRLGVLDAAEGRSSSPVPASMRWRVTIALALVALIVPGTAYRVDQLRSAVAAGRQPFFLRPGERDALRWLERQPGPGGVLTPVYSGLLVPAYTGRATWIGAGSWTPDFAAREQATERLFAGQLDANQAVALIRRSGARFLYSDCHARADISAEVAAATSAPVRFGCATVWRVRRS